MRILVLNAGSSSQKSCLYDLRAPLPETPPPPLWSGTIDWGRSDRDADLRVATARGDRLEATTPIASHRAAIRHMLDLLWSGTTSVVSGPGDIDLVGHRIVHAGGKYRESTAMTPEVKAAIRQFTPCAPTHNPAALEGMALIEEALPHAAQVAVFDTAFHADLPPAAAVYPGPYDWLAQGIRRYGFHGISHQYCAGRAARILKRDLESLRLVTCHLGNGASLAAIQHGRSIDTTMGFTPLEGLMMGSRSGTVDPGILTYLMRERNCPAEEIDRILNQASGLLGISGLSGDMRHILQARREGHERARLAFDIYVHRLRAHLGAMLAALGGIDALVFTGGVGEHSADVRAAACEPFGCLGVSLDEAKNAASPADEDIAAAEARVRALIVRTEEDWMIARECWRVGRGEGVNK